MGAGAREATKGQKPPIDLGPDRAPHYESFTKLFGIDTAVGHTMEPCNVFRSRAIMLRSRAIAAIASPTRIPAERHSLFNPAKPVPELLPVAYCLFRLCQCFG